MASFDPNVPVKDPTSYMTYQYSQGTDKAQLQPLASTPDLSTRVVTPDYAPNKSVGKALEGAAELLKGGLKLTDDVITSKMTDQVRDGVNQIRDSFGVAQAADAAKDLPSPTDVKGLSLSADQVDPNLPIAVNRLGNKIEGLNEAYRQGVFDETPYYGKLEALVRQVKQQFPGYEDKIDEKVREFTGVTPANALRSALLNNVKELNAKLTAKADKQATMEHQDAAYIHTLWPDYEQRKLAGTAPPWEEVQQGVGKLKAQEWQYSAKSAELALDKGMRDSVSSKAETLASARLTNMAGNIVLGATNSMGLRSTGDFQKLFDAINSGQRAPLTPDEQAQVRQSLAQLKQAYQVRADNIMNEPLVKGGIETLSTKLYSQEKRTALIKQGGALIDQIEDGLLNEKYGQVAHDVTWNAAQQAAAEGDFIKSNPAGLTQAAGRKFLGDQGMLMVNMANPEVLEKVAEGYRQWALGKIATPGSDAADTYKLFADNGQLDPGLWKKSLEDWNRIFLNPKNTADKDAQNKAFDYMYKRGTADLVKAYKEDPGSQINLFNRLLSPTITREVLKLDKGRQEAFFRYADDGFQSVYATQAMGVNQAAKAWAGQGNLKLEYDADAGNFKYTSSKGMFYPKAPDSALRNANAQLAPLNSAVNAMKEVWKAEGKNPAEQLATLLPRMGIAPDSPLAKAMEAGVKAKEKDKGTNNENP